VSGRLKSIVKHRIWGLGKRVSCAKNGWCFLRNELLFGAPDDCTCIKIFSGVNFLNHD